MVSPTQLRSWRPDRLAAISDEVAAHRRALIDQSDELAAGKVPTSWTLDSALAAQAAHRRLADGLATQVAEAANVIAALDAAVAAIRSAKDDLNGAYDAASRHDLRIDGTTGAVRITRSYDNTSDAAYAATQANYVRAQVDDALSAAAAADEALAAALRTAATTDTNTVGTLAQQREILEFTELSPSAQVDYLLEHPESYALLDDYASPQVKEIVGERMAEEIDAIARDSTALLDPENVERCEALVQAFGSDATVMAAMYENLEPSGALGLFSTVSAAIGNTGDPQSLIVLADGLRSGLQTATQSPDFDGDAYGREMVRYATYQMPDVDLAVYESAYPYANFANASVLDYLLREGDYGETFVRGVVLEFDSFERQYPRGALDWAHFNSMQSPLNGLDDVGFMYQPDPMAQAMGQLGNHPQLGLEFFTDPDDGAARTEFYLSERDWSRDGFAGISEAALGIGTDPGTLTGAPEATARFVSEFFDRVPDNPAFNADHARAASEPIADLLKHYIPAVELATGTGTDFPADVRALDTSPYLPGAEYYPLLDKPDLDGLLKVALSTEDGMARIAEGVAGYRQEQLTQFAAQHPDGATTHNADLQSIIDRSGRLEGYMQHAVGDIAIEGAVSRDQQVAVFTGLVSEAVGLIPVPGADAVGDVLGDVAKDALGAAWNKVGEIPGETITEAFGNNADAVRDQQTGEAMLGREKAVIGTYLALAHAGIVDVPPAMLDTWAPGGTLVTLDDIPPRDIQTFRGEALDAMGAVVSATQLEIMYKDPFTTWYTK